MSAATPVASLPTGIVPRAIERCHGHAPPQPLLDHVAIEEPLEIRIAFGPPGARTVKPVAVTMRTPTSPQHDFELAHGLLFAEGLLHAPGDVERTYHCGPETASHPPHRLHNVIRLDLDPSVGVGGDLARLERHFVMSSSCGVCGKTTLDALQTRCAIPAQADDDFAIAPDLLLALPDLLRHTQTIFDATGGLHAAALFDPLGKLLALREDVGRHNALDKLIGSRFLARALPAHNTLLLVSGRASFELLQKAAMAGIPFLAAVGAPSSLAIDLADRFGITLVGFLRERRFNIYTHPHRIGSPSVAVPQGVSS